MSENDNNHVHHRHNGDDCKIPGGSASPDDCIKEVVGLLCKPQSYERVYYRDRHDVPMPSPQVLREVMEDLRTIFFPGYFGNSHLTPETMPFYIGAAVDHVSRFLSEQFMSGFCVTCFREDEGYCVDCHSKARETVNRFLRRLPHIRQMLATDVEAAFRGDPASKNRNEVIFCYPSIKAMTSHRVAHELYKLGVPLIPRIISEMAHSETGIDIHPGARIDEYFFMDHGTGIVIGETAVIGRNVRIYQGVTLGAKSFPTDEVGDPIKGIPRHPIVEDHVTIYAGSTILGRVTIGKNSIIGGNVWLTTDVPPDTRVNQHQPKKHFITNE